MRIILWLSVLALASCGKPEPSDSSRTRSDGASERAAPGIAVTAAPGVAFTYDYAFRLPNAKISAVQEQHAQACEKLGIDRCRITGMRYTVASQDDISAMLSFKLEPSIARAFGKEGIAAVERASGMLVNAEISGTDAAAVIASANKAGDSLRSELTKIETRLKETGISASERADLIAQAADLRTRLQATATEKDDARASLATTPMTFDYRSGDVLTGSPLRDAVSLGASSFVAMLGFVVVAVAVSLPWIALAALGYWLFLQVRRRWPKPIARAD